MKENKRLREEEEDEDEDERMKVKGAASSQLLPGNDPLEVQ